MVWNDSVCILGTAESFDDTRTRVGYRRHQRDQMVPATEAVVDYFDSDHYRDLRTARG